MNDPVTSCTLEIEPAIQKRLFGRQDRHLIRIERLCDVQISARNAHVTIRGNPDGVTRAGGILGSLSRLLQDGLKMTEVGMVDALRILEHDPEVELIEFFRGTHLPPTLLKYVRPRSLNQKAYLEAIVSNDMVLAVGPAGTGKTYLAVAMACAWLADRKVRRIILTRPAVEAGEKLGFLPGDIAAKVDPYLRPLYDALYDMLGYEKVTRLIGQDVIEIAPIAFMRGRTLNDAFIILDEAQNTTTEQMKMFLTRMGFSSRVVVTGDITQIDLPHGKRSGLKEARWILDGVDGIMIVVMDERDVVRHPLVQNIITAYERAEDS